MADGEGSTDHLARRCENRHRPPASRRANTHTHAHTHTHTHTHVSCTQEHVLARPRAQLRGRRKFLECVGGERSETAETTGNTMDDRAAIARRCALSNLLT